MEQLIPMKVVLLLIAIVSWPGVCAAFPCSLVVNVETTTGYKEVPVTVEEKGGVRTEVKTVDGVARFCGLGAYSVTVRAGVPNCSVVTVEPVFLDLQKTTHLKMFLNDAPCAYDLKPLPPKGCPYLFRIFGPDRHVVSNASVQFGLAASSPVEKADSYGRLLYTMKPQRGVPVKIAAPGYSTEQTEVSCAQPGVKIEEKIVILQKK